jgi:hypothetical protein
MSVPLATLVVHIILLVVLLFLYVVGTLLMLRRRSHALIRTRSLGLVIAQETFMISLTTVNIVSIVFYTSQSSCGVWIFLSLFTFLSFLLTISVRLVRLLLKFVYAQQAIADFARRAENSPTLVAEDKPWLLRNWRKLAKRPIQFGITMSLVALVLLPFLIELAIRPDLTRIKAYEKQCVQIAWIFTQISGAIALVICIPTGYVIYRLKKCRENFFIKSEMAWIALTFVYVFIIVIIVWTHHEILDFGFSRAEFYGLLIFLFVIPNLCTLGASYYRTLWLCRVREGENRVKKMARSSQRDSRSTGTGLDDFRNMIRDAEGFNLFRQFLIKELSVENLLFWREVEAYQQFEESGLPAEKLLEKGKDIYNRYVDLNAASMSINISWMARKDITAAFGDSCGTYVSGVFQKAQDEVVMLLFNDSYRRFAMTVAFTEYTTSSTKSS